MPQVVSAGHLVVVWFTQVAKPGARRTTSSGHSGAPPPALHPSPSRRTTRSSRTTFEELGHAHDDEEGGEKENWCGWGWCCGAMHHPCCIAYMWSVGPCSVIRCGAIASLFRDLNTKPYLLYSFVYNAQKQSVNTVWVPM